MRVDSEKLFAHLQRGLKPLYTIYGGEPLLALEAADRIRATARDIGYGEREVMIAEAGFNWARLASFGANLSLFSARRLLELRIPSGKPGTEGSEALQRFCASSPADVLVLISLPKLDRQTLTSKWFSRLEQTGVVVAAEPVERARLPRWIAGRLALQQQRADAATLSFIAEKVEGNLLAAHHEVQKLGLLFPPAALDFENVRNAVLDVARFDVFKLNEALLEGDPARLIRFLDGLRGEGVAPPLVLWALSEEIRVLLQIRTGLESGSPIADLMREYRIWGARQKLLPRAIERYGRKLLEDALLESAAIDRLIKGLTKGDPWERLARLGLRLVVRPPNAAA